VRAARYRYHPKALFLPPWGPRSSNTGQCLQSVRKVLLVWILLGGAGTLAATGYLVTGNPVSAIVTGLAIVAFWLCGPNAFAKA
jgi:hypothetical protein